MLPWTLQSNESYLGEVNLSCPRDRHKQAPIFPLVLAQLLAYGL